MNTTDLAIALVIVQALIASPSVVELVKGWFGRRKGLAAAGRDDATSAQIMVNTATKLANDLGKRLDETNTLVAKLQSAITTRDQRITELEAQNSAKDKHIARLEAKVDLLIKLYGRDPFESESRKPGTGPLGKGA